MEQVEFKVGDRVEIVTLSKPGESMSGHIGHKGVITKGRAGKNPFYELTPNCLGGSWPAWCLRHTIKELYKIY
tara:strand:+ start:5518 stop:5736 length:219 start_codon:yes stop_codon:yes gene_type:complete